MTHRRPGFALLTVLLVIAGASTVAMAMAVEASTANAAARNRINGERAHWAARGCLADVAYAVDLALERAVRADARTRTWRALASHLDPSALPGPGRCTVQIEAAGARLDLNRATEEQLLALFQAVGLGSERRDLAHALLDWIDEDDLPREQGAERATYVATHRLPPRNAPLADVRELAHVRGFERHIGLLADLLTVDGERVSLDHAAREVLSTLPGFTSEVVERVIDRRESRTPFDDLREVLGAVSVGAAEGLMDRFPDLTQAATTGVEAWIVTIGAEAGAPAITSRIEARLVRAGDRARIASWRFE